MDTPVLNLYVYYKIPVNQHNECLLAVKQLQNAVELRYPAVIKEQQKRTNLDTSNQETWMEIYAGIKPTQLESLIADLMKLAKTYRLPSDRKNEVFTNL